MPEVNFAPESAINTSESVSINRRDFLKYVAVSAFGGVVLSGCGVPEVVGSNEDKDNPLSVEPLPFSDDTFIASIEKNRQIRLISAEQAYGQIIGDNSEFIDSLMFGNVPLAWDHGRAKLINKFLLDLPEYFYGKGGNGETLHIGLTDLLRKDRAAAYYQEHPGIEMKKKGEGRQMDLIMIDAGNFSPDSPLSSMWLLVHELTHRFQGEEGKFVEHQKMLENIFGTTMDEVCKKTINKLKNALTDDWRYKNPLYPLLMDSLKYGVFDEEKKIARSDHLEYEAVMSEIYLSGEKIFTGFFRKFYGREKSVKLYEFMRDSVFGGKEYDGKTYNL